MDSFQLFSNADGSSAKRCALRRATIFAFLVAAWLASPVLMAANGDLDPTFSGGAFDIPIGPVLDIARSVTFQDDGRVLLGGSSTPASGSSSNSYWALVRRNTGGTLDATFGGGTGQVITQVGGHLGNGLDGSIYGVVVQPDRKILGVGIGLDRTGTYFNFHLIRWNTDGTPDATFGNNGNGGVTTFLSTSGDIARAVVLQRDRKPIVIGSEYAPNDAGPLQPVVVRYMTDGRLDSSFGTRGIFRLPASVPADELGPVSSIATQPDGKIVVGFGSVAGNWHPEVMRLTSDGVLDSTFGVGGIASVNLPNELTAGLAVQPDGKIIAGASNPGVSGSVFRLNSNGSLDTTFNGKGWIDLPLDVETMALLPTGQVLVSGNEGYPSSMVVVARITADGQLDTSFTNSNGQSGIVGSQGPGGGYVEIEDMMLLPDGRFVIAGRDTNHFVVARYQGDALDLLPKTAAFTSVTGVPVSTVQVSNVITIAGLTNGAFVPILVYGGNYSINGDPFVSTLGYVKNGDQVMVDHTSAATPGTSVTTTLRVGGLSPPNSPWILHGSKVIAAFTSTTQ